MPVPTKAQIRGLPSTSLLADETASPLLHRAAMPQVVPSPPSLAAVPNTARALTGSKNAASKPAADSLPCLLPISPRGGSS